MAHYIIQYEYDEPVDYPAPETPGFYDEFKIVWHRRKSRSLSIKGDYFRVCFTPIYQCESCQILGPPWKVETRFFNSMAFKPRDFYHDLCSACWDKAKTEVREFEKLNKLRLLTKKLRRGKPDGE